MVAYAINYNIPDLRDFDIFNQWFCIGTIYLHNILMNREKALESVIVLALVSLIIYLKFEVSWIVYLVIFFLAISFISKKLTIFIGNIWFSLSHYLGIVMNQIIMFLIFYIVLTPLAFFQRLAGKNQILKKESENSYFHQRNHLFSNKDIEYPW